MIATFGFPQEIRPAHCVHGLFDPDSVCVNHSMSADKDLRLGSAEILPG